MRISYRSIGLALLCLGTCLIFFNPFNLGNEVLPYYLLTIFFVPLRIKDYLISVFLLIAAVIWSIYYPSFRVFIDPIMVISTIFAFRFFNDLDEKEKGVFLNFIKYFIFFNTIVCIAQNYSDFFQILAYSFFSGRDYTAGVSFLDRGVTGLAPEPAYGSAMIIGLALIHSAFYRPTILFLGAVTLTIYLQSSISGVAFFLLFLSFIFLRYFYDVTRSISLRTLTTIYILIAVIIIIYLSQLDFSLIIQNLTRLISFIEFISEEGNILKAEEQTGSVRLILIYLSFADLIHTDYAPGFSYFGYLNRIFATPLISLIVLLYLLYTYKISLSYLIVLLFGFLAGPVLIWPLYYLIFYGLPKKIG